MDGKDCCFENQKFKFNANVLNQTLQDQGNGNLE